jgi:hypothetical protein
MAIILAGSWITFQILARRAMEDRHAVALSEWGRDHGFRLRVWTADDPLPPPLNAVSSHRLAVRFCLIGKQVTLIRIESFGPPSQTPAADAPWHGVVWNLLIREIETDWPPTGLRPVAAANSALDLFSLSSFPLLGSVLRFMIYGTESNAAVALSRSPARGLLPPDVGLLLHRRYLLLDFSGRPFDAIEFDRIMGLAEQLVGRLPGPQVTA